MTNSTQSFVHDPYTTISNDTFHQDFRVINRKSWRNALSVLIIIMNMLIDQYPMQFGGPPRHINTTRVHASHALLLPLNGRRPGHS